MEAPDHLPLAQLKQAIKDFKTKETPKLSSKKSVLSEYAKRVGILRSAAPVLSTTPPAPVPVAAAPKAPKKPEPLPDILKAVPRETRIEPKAAAKPTKKAAVATPAPEAPKKKGSPFSAFMADHKGQGYSMAQLAAMYKGQK